MQDDYWAVHTANCHLCEHMAVAAQCSSRGKTANVEVVLLAREGLACAPCLWLGRTSSVTE